MSNGDYVSTDSIYEMLKHTKTEYGLAYKVNETRLSVTGYQRQRVKYAVQLLSKSCANALKFLGEKGLLKSKNWRETLDFIILMNDRFDAMNSNNMHDDIPMRNAFGFSVKEQTEILDEVTSLMNEMRVKSPKTRYLYKFQNGIMVSSQSLVGLFEMLKTLYNIDYIMTQRLNQD